MGRIETVQDVLGRSISDAINGSTITAKGKVKRGYVRPEDLRISANADGWRISINPAQSGGRRLPARGVQRRYFTLEPAGLIGLKTSTGITFSGTVRAGLNLRVFVRHPSLGNIAIPYATGANDSLTTVASAIAAGINAHPAPLSASASGAIVTISGSLETSCNVGSTGTITREVARFEQMLSINIYAATADIRSQLVDVVTSKIGNSSMYEYDLSDGTSAQIWQNVPASYKDNSQSDYGVYEAMILYAANYPILDVEEATQVVETRTSIDTPFTDAELFIGG